MYATASLRENDLTLLQRLVPKMLEHFRETAPPGADTSSWAY
jgi:hypothetical protein